MAGAGPVWRSPLCGALPMESEEGAELLPQPATQIAMAIGKRRARIRGTRGLPGVVRCCVTGVLR
jgi:hypothetical protein